MEKHVLWSADVVNCNRMRSKVPVQNCQTRELFSTCKMLHELGFSVALVELMSFPLTCMPGESYHR